MDNQRVEDARRREELALGQERHEAVQAQRLIDDFIAQATEQRVQPEPLWAVTHNGTRVKTDKLGWYLRKNRSIAIGTDGGYYILTVAMAGGLLRRFRGVKLQPVPPPLIVGRGARDGESGPLADFLEWRLADG
ncbi:MAG: hypothetical protein M0Z51_04235 [Propionibacterium sp.]|nr:hypothetical protein [Propionibacterium sp.]